MIDFNGRLIHELRNEVLTQYGEIRKLKERLENTEDRLNLLGRILTGEIKLSVIKTDEGITTKCEVKE